MEERKPLVSVIVPVYNVYPYLRDCVQSVQAQSYQNWELLLVDDGSTDGSGELCDELAAEDGRIRVFHKPNGGQSDARNVGLKQAQGKYFYLLDSDDLIRSTAFDQFVERCEADGADAALTPLEMFSTEQPEGRTENPHQIPELLNREETMRRMLLHQGIGLFRTAEHGLEGHLQLLELAAHGGYLRHELFHGEGGSQAAYGLLQGLAALVKLTHLPVGLRGLACHLLHLVHGLVEPGAQLVDHEEFYSYRFHLFQFTLIKSCYLPRLVLRALFRFFPHVTRRVAQHHDQRLVVHAAEDVVHAPARGVRYLPHKPERAMGAFVTAL